jgi:hypothetical protein
MGSSARTGGEYAEMAKQRQLLTRFRTFKTEQPATKG